VNTEPYARFMNPGKGCCDKVVRVCSAITVCHDIKGVLTLNDDVPDRIAKFMGVYFQFKVTNSTSFPSAQK